MENIEARNRKLLSKANRYYFARSILVLLTLLTFLGAFTVLFTYHGAYDAVAMAEQGFIGAFFWLFLANAMHLRITHIESIRHYLKEER